MSDAHDLLIDASFHDGEVLVGASAVIDTLAMRSSKIVELTFTDVSDVTLDVLTYVTWYDSTERDRIGFPMTFELSTSDGYSLTTEYTVDIDTRHPLLALKEMQTQAEETQESNTSISVVFAGAITVTIILIALYQLVKQLCKKNEKNNASFYDKADSNTALLDQYSVERKD